MKLQRLQKFAEELSVVCESRMSERHADLQDAIMDEFDLTDESRRLKQIMSYLLDNKDSDDLDDYLFMHFEEDMPYGVRKARSGDPKDWIANRMEQLFHKYY